MSEELIKRLADAVMSCDSMTDVERLQVERAIRSQLPAVAEWNSRPAPAVQAPDEPTMAMREAGNKALDALKTEPGMVTADRAYYVYRAMLAATPTPAPVATEAVAQGGVVDVEKVMALVEEYGKRREDIGVGFDEVAKASSVCDEIRALLASTAVPVGDGWTLALEHDWLQKRQMELIASGMKIAQAEIHAKAQLLTARVQVMRAAAPAATKKEGE